MVKFTIMMVAFTTNHQSTGLVMKTKDPTITLLTTRMMGGVQPQRGQGSEHHHHPNKSLGDDGVHPSKKMVGQHHDHPALLQCGRPLVVDKMGGDGDRKGLGNIDNKLSDLKSISNGNEKLDSIEDRPNTCKTHICYKSICFEQPFQKIIFGFF